MPVKKYVNINGRTVAEHTNGVRTSYLTDALGSITATVNSSQTVVNTYRWKPFGERLAKTGAGADPTLGWVGAYGYRRTQRSRSEYYMLARHYDSLGGRWTTVDPLWPRSPEYTYCSSNPALRIDPVGLEDIDPIGGIYRGHSSCSSFQVPLPPVGFLAVARTTFSLQVCVRCFNTTCCPPGDWAKACFSVSANLTITIGSLPIKELLDLLNIRNTVEGIRRVETALRLVVGGAAGLMQCQSGDFACIGKSEQYTADICIRVCAFLMSMQCCFGSGGFSCSSANTYCGSPSLQLRARVRYVKCV